MKRQNVRTLSLIVVTFTYLLLGAAIFDAFESHNEGDEERRLKVLAQELRQKYNMTQDDFDHITQLGIQMKPYKAGAQWKFAGAFYFATTVITTIGYGHSTPKTTYGKIFCMCYAVPGIPLCLVMFQSIGERMNTIITCLLKQIKKLCSCKCRTVSQTNLMLVSFTTGASVLTLGAAVFSRYEDWSYLDSFYYCFITLTTIGFGDFVALQRNDSLARRPDYVAFSLIFILFGLTVVSSVMNLLVLRFLTMNTEDERRDQLVAAAHAQELQRLRGDVIWSDDKMSNCDHAAAIEMRARQLTNKIPYETYEVDTYSLRPPFQRSLQKFFNGLSTLFTSQSRFSLLPPCQALPSNQITDRMELRGHNPRCASLESPFCPNGSFHHQPQLHRSQSLPDSIIRNKEKTLSTRYSEVVRKSNALLGISPLVLCPSSVSYSTQCEHEGLPQTFQTTSGHSRVLDCAFGGNHHLDNASLHYLWMQRHAAQCARIPRNDIEAGFEHRSRIDRHLDASYDYRSDDMWSERITESSQSSCDLEQVVVSTNDIADEEDLQLEDMELAERRRMSL